MEEPSKVTVYLLEELEKCKTDYQEAKDQLEYPQILIEKKEESLKLLLCKLYEEITGKKAELRIVKGRTIKPPKKAGTVRGPNDNTSRRLSNRKNKETPGSRIRNP